jgi:hypothetical protein
MTLSLFPFPSSLQVKPSNNDAICLAPPEFYLLTRRSAVVLILVMRIVSLIVFIFTNNTSGFSACPEMSMSVYFQAV